MAGQLYTLFDESYRRTNSLVASPPTNLDDISSVEETQELTLSRIKKLQEVHFKVDYSDFSNFVYFNSAFDYFNITGEKILNEYPYDGTDASIQNFLDDLDGYQNSVVSMWPKCVGTLFFKPASGKAYILVDDIGVDASVSKTGLLSPGTGSVSLEFWCIPPPALTGSNDAMFVVQKISGSDGYSTYFSGSSLFFKVNSGSTSIELSSPTVPGQVSYFSCVLDRGFDVPLITVFSGSTTQFPAAVVSSSTSVGPMYIGGSRLSIASGTISGKINVPLTGALDDVRIWNIARSIQDLSGTFNTRVNSQTGLVGLWRFNETGSLNSNDVVIVRDASGHRLNGKIQNYFSGFRASGSLLPYDAGDLLLDFSSPEVQSLISDQQTSGSLYDKTNDNIITNLMPSQFFQLEEFKNTDVLQKFLYIIARQFDEIKVSVDQFLNLFKTKYSRFNQTPDALLEEVGRYLGWEFTGNFLNASAFQYIFGRDVLFNLESNKELDLKLFEIKNEFWRRTLINLIYLYKTKGTRESVESLLRIYGVNRNFVRLKEFGYRPDVGVQTKRISSEKSIPVLAFGSASFSGSNIRSPVFSSNVKTLETRVCFPTDHSNTMTASLITGSIWKLGTGSLETTLLQLYYTKSAVSSQTGSLILTSSIGQLVLTGANIFDERWYNVSVTCDPLSSSLSIEARSMNDGVIDKFMRATSTSLPASSSTGLILQLGAIPNMATQMWNQEVRVWDRALDSQELDDHTLNFQSYGTKRSDGFSNLKLHWRLDENQTTSSSGTIQPILDLTTNGNMGSGSFFAPSINSYRKFLLPYEFIAPLDFGWNEERVRSLPSSVVRPSDRFLDSRIVSLEFNMIDALNEDISQIISTLESFNNFIGIPANRYRDSYTDLEIIRRNYFKRLQGQLNFRLFSDMLEFFDRSFVEMVRRLIPARVLFLGDEFAVESHMLERPKLQWNYRRQQPQLQPEGKIQMYIRT